MPKLKNLSGDEVINILERLDFFVVSQKGSHVKLRRVLGDGTKQSLTIPKHKELDRGTLKAIYNQVLKFIPEEQLRLFFYTD